MARQLGGSGEMVIRQLGVPDHVVSALRKSHANDPVEFHLYCLIKWCETKRADANPHNLKTALAANERNDLVDLVDEYLSGKTAGYTTD